MKEKERSDEEGKRESRKEGTKRANVNKREIMKRKRKKFAEKEEENKRRKKEDSNKLSEKRRKEGRKIKEGSS